MNVERRSNGSMSNHNNNNHHLSVFMNNLMTIHHHPNNNSNDNIVAGLRMGHDHVQQTVVDEKIDFVLVQDHCRTHQRRRPIVSPTTITQRMDNLDDVQWPAEKQQQQQQQQRYTPCDNDIGNENGEKDAPHVVVGVTPTTTKMIRTNEETHSVVVVTVVGGDDDDDDDTPPRVPHGDTCRTMERSMCN